MKIFSIVSVCDNTGVLEVKCIRLFPKRKQALVGTKLLSVVTTVKTKKSNKFKKSELVKAVVVKHSQAIKRLCGDISFYSNSAVVLLKDDWTTPFATRILGIVPIELRKNGYLKIISLSFGLI
jgi:large subunit ribosomal protein L14